MNSIKVTFYPPISSITQVSHIYLEFETGKTLEEIEIILGELFPKLNTVTNNFSYVYYIYKENIVTNKTMVVELGSEINLLQPLSGG